MMVAVIHTVARVAIPAATRASLRAVMPATGSRIFRDRRGQGTVEYLIVGLALMAVVAGLGVLSGRLGEGLFVQHALEGASHTLGGNAWETMGDVLLY